MNQKSRHIVSFCGAVGCALLACIIDCNLAQAADRSIAENVIRHLMPDESQCRSAESERLFYCRYATPKTFDVVIDLSFGPGGPGASLTACNRDQSPAEQHCRDQTAAAQAVNLAKFCRSERSGTSIGLPNVMFEIQPVSHAIPRRDPADPEKTTRVLTIGFMSDY